MSNPKNITGAVVCQATLPRVSESDGEKAEGHSLPDLIAADKYIRNLAALQGCSSNGGARSAWGKVRMAIAIPPGAV